MRFAACLLVLVVSAAHAQPTGHRSPPDEALIDQVVEALRVEDQMAALFSGVGGLLTGVPLTPAVVADSIRARLRADYRPDLLRTALPTLRSTAYEHAMDRAADRGSSFARAAQLMYGPPPKKGTLADSVLAALYLNAAGTERTLRITMERTIRAVVENAPEARTQIQMDTEGLTVDQAIEGAIAGTSETISMFALPAMRVELAGMPVGEVETLIAYYGSPAGEYVQSALLEGTLDAFIPTIVVLATEEIPAYPEEATGTGTVVTPPDSVPAPKVKF